MRYSYSELQQFQNCEREYQYRYDQLLEPVFDGLPKPVGGALHVGLEHLYAGESADACVKHAFARYWDELQPVLDEIKTNDAWRVEESNEADQIRKIEGGWRMVGHMLEHYPWLDIPDILHTEAVITVDMGHGREYIGAVDRVMGVNGGVWNHDTKSSGFHPPPVIKTMRLRHQFAGYTHLVDTWLRGDAHTGPAIPETLRGKTVEGTILDMVFKPRVTFHRKAKAFTGEVSCKGEHYHREPLHISGEHVSEFKAWFHTLVDRIEVHDDPRPKNTGNCFSFNRVCAFFEMCRSSKRATRIAEGGEFKVKGGKHEYYAK